MQTGLILFLAGAGMLAAAAVLLRYFGRHPVPQPFETPSPGDSALRPRPTASAPSGGTVSALEKTEIVPEDQ